MSETQVNVGESGASGRIVIIVGESILYDTPIVLRQPADVPDFIPERWLAGILAHIDDKFIPGWAEVLDTEDHFLSKLAEPAAAGYTPFLNPFQVSRRGLTGMQSTQVHAKKLARSYEKMKAAIDFLTGDGREDFELKLQESQDTYRDGETYPLSLTGDYVQQLLGAAVRQWFFLNGDPRFLVYQWQTDYLEGKWPFTPPFLIEVPKWDVARMHQNLLVQGGVFSLRGIAVQKVHDALDEFLTSWLSDNYLPPPDSWIRFQTIEGSLHLRTLISFLPGP